MNKQFTRGWSLEAKMAFYTDTEGECLEWVGPLNTSGYGILAVNGRTTLAHRNIWLIKTRKAWEHVK